MLEASRIPYVAIGELRYGGRLHGLLAGAVFAGTGVVVNACPGPSGLPTRCSCGSIAELYYLDPGHMQLLDARLGALGARRETVVIRHGGAEIMAEAHLDPGGQGDCSQPRWLRLLLLLPPLLPPPTAPMASVTVRIRGLRPCRGGSAFCPAPGEEQEAAAADIYASTVLLDGWLAAHGLRLAETLGRPATGGPLMLLYAPVAGEDEGTGLTPDKD